MSKALWKGPVCEKLKSTCDNLGAVYCCDRKARAACAQSFALWQQTTTVIMRRNHSIITCSRHFCVVLFFGHISFVVNQTFNATPTERLQQHPLVLQRTASIARSFCGGCIWHDRMNTASEDRYLYRWLLWAAKECLHGVLSACAR